VKLQVIAASPDRGETLLLRQRQRSEMLMRRLVGATFVATQIGSLLSICALGLLPAGSTRPRFDKRLPPLRALFRNGTLIAYGRRSPGTPRRSSRAGLFVAYLAWLLPFPTIK
jgi:hypothetical protein